MSGKGGRGVFVSYFISERLFYTQFVQGQMPKQLQSKREIFPICFLPRGCLCEPNVYVLSLDLRLTICDK